MAPSTSGPRDSASRRLHAVGPDDPRPRVLIVDDDPVIRSALSAALEDEGYHTLQAHDGAEALDLLLSVAEPLVVVVDWMMPQLNGLALLQIVAADPILSRRHAYLMTSAAFPSGLKHVATLPLSLPVEVLMQPINVQVFLTKIAQASDRLRRAPAEPRGANEHK